MKNLVLKTLAGQHFDSAAKKAQQTATDSQNVEFDFNGIKCVVSKSTNLKWLSRDYTNSFTMEWKTIGPDCVEKYSPEIESEFKTKKEVRDIESQRIAAEYAAKDKSEKQTFEDSVKGIEMEFSDKKAWEEGLYKNSDPYGAACYEYAEGWAKLMQKEIALGKTVRECADETQKGLGFMGITGFMYGAAVSVLSKCWKYGEELRKWHN